MCEKSHLPFFPLYFSRFFLSLTVLWYCRFGLQGKKVLQYIQIRMIKMDFSFVSCANTMLKMSPLWLHNGIYGMIVNRYQMSQREWKRDNFFYISRSRVSLLCLSFFFVHFICEHKLVSFSFWPMNVHCGEQNLWKI